MHEVCQAPPVDSPEGPTASFQNGKAPAGEGTWWKAGRVETFPQDGGMAVDYAGAQLAVFHVAATGKWYASQNMCPHKQDMLLARGIVGEKDGTPKVACTPRAVPGFHHVSWGIAGGSPVPVTTGCHRRLAGVGSAEQAKKPGG